MKKIMISILVGASLSVVVPSSINADSLFQQAKEEEKKAKSLGGEFEVVDLYKLPKKVFKVHDLVTVQIKETMKASNKKDSTTSKESSLLAEVKKHFTLDTAFTENSDLYGARADIRGAGGLPATELNGEKEFKGSVNIKDDTSYEATITCEVIKVLPNGNLILEAQKTTKHNKEEQSIRFTGTIRSADVSSNNTVESSKVHNSKIEFKGKGPLSNTAKKGLMTRLLDFVFPI